MAAEMKASFGLLYQHTAGHVQWSPDGRYLATVVGQRLVVRDAVTFEIVQGGLQSCPDKIEGLEWGADSDIIVCALYKRGMVALFSLSNPDWHCQIREGVAGMVGSCLAPQARHVLTFSDFGLHVSLWSLATQKAVHIRQPAAAPSCTVFSPDGKLLAVGTRKKCKDGVVLVDLATQEALCEFPVDTSNLTSLQWAPDGNSLLAQDSCLCYLVLAYSLDGRLLRKFEAYQNALGVKSLGWSPGGAFLSIGSYDQCLRVLTGASWKLVCELRHNAAALGKGPAANRKAAVYREVVVEKEVDSPDESEVAPALTVGSSTQEAGSRRAGARDTLEGKRARGSASTADITYVSSLPPTLPLEKPDATQPNPRLGVGLIAWSSSGRYMATRNDNMPTMLWIWDMEALRLCSVLIQLAPVRCPKWHPRENTLALCTGNGRVYFWKPGGASWVAVPSPGFDVMALRWNPEGSSLVLLSRDRLCSMSLTHH